MTRERTKPDAVVVGAGPAGSAAALVLARAGADVLVCEQAAFPRRKVCGGCLSGDAVAALGRLLGDGVSRLGVPVNHIIFHIGRHRFSAPEAGRCRVVAREVLDLALAEAAAAAGADVRFERRARVVESSPHELAVRIGGELYTPAWIVWAAGPLPVFANRVGARPTRRLVGQAQSVVAAGDDLTVGDVAMHWLRGGYVGLARLSAEQTLVAWAAEAQVLAGRRPWDALRAANTDSVVLRELAIDASSAAPATAGFPLRPAGIGVDNLLLAGDAVGFEEPFSGEGIGQALRSGEAAAFAILAGGSREVVRGRYAVLLAGHRRVRRRTRWLSAALRHPLTRALLDSRLPIPAEVGQRLLARIHVRGTECGAAL